LTTSFPKYLQPTLGPRNETLDLPIVSYHPVVQATSSKCRGYHTIISIRSK